jgi:DNA-binding PadR family transcriptional regulator
MSTAAGWCGPGFDMDALLRWAAGTRASMTSSRRGHGGWGWWGPPPGAWGQEGWGSGKRGRGPAWPFEPPRARAGRGDIRLAILALLREGPRHGYQMIGEIAERSGGAWTPSPGSVYPALSALQDEGLIDDEKIDGKRVFSLTDAGREYVERRTDDIERVFAENAAEQEHPEAADLRELIMGVGGAALSVLGSGTPEQRERARDILARTRRELYLILAEQQEER